MCSTHRQQPTFREAFWIWVKVALYSFGGPANQIAVMHRLVVEEKNWVSETRFLHALNYCMLLPGPEAQELAIYLGWLLHRVKGGIVAGSLFVLPGFLSIALLSILYASFYSLYFVQGLFYGLKPAVVAIVFSALIQMGRKTLRQPIMLVLALGAFVGLFVFNVPFPVIIIGAALIGLIGGYSGLALFNHEGVNEAEATVQINESYGTGTPSILKLIRTVFIGLTFWCLPTLLLFAFLGPTSVYTQEAWFFSKTAVVTFGGAYAVLAYIAQQAVHYYGWLNPGEMLDGLGMAETTPGPLIQVVQFIGFLAAFRAPGTLPPIVAGILGSLITAWVTFVPPFLWIFAGAPYMEKIRQVRVVNTAFKAITAAVVGVILNLAVWFTINTLFTNVTQQFWGIVQWFIPDWETFQVGSFMIMTVTSIMIFRYKFGIFSVLITGVLAGYIWLYLAMLI